MTKIVWPSGWVGQAVRAPGVKWTAAAPTRGGAVGVAIADFSGAREAVVS